MQRTLLRQGYGGQAKDGFTFIEVMVALAILTIIAAVVFHSHTSILKAEERARSIEESCLVASRLASRTWMGISPVETAADEHKGWEIQLNPLEIRDGTNSFTWNEWTISPSNRPSQKTLLYLMASSSTGASKRSNQ